VIAFLLLGLLLAGSSVALAARSLVLRRMRTGESLDQIDSYGFSASSGRAGATNSGVRTALDELAAGVGGFLAPSAGSKREVELRTALMAAGLYNIPPRNFQGYRLLGAVGVPAAWLFLGSQVFGSAFVFVLFPLAVVAGWMTPMVILKNRGRRRTEEIDWELPELIDLLVVTVEAGLGFNSSLRTAAERLEGPLGDELRLTLQEQSMGLSTTEALKNMLARCDSPAMRSFVRAIVQGEQLGVSIGQIMRDLALEMRKRRRQAAEEKAHKAPIKILFPLVFLIFPPMFVVLLAPAVYSFLDAF
jgi:tight adherence protein C